MFKFVHHVRILVHDADAMVQYMAQTLAMTPVKVQVYASRGMKNAMYQVGETNLEFTEPLDAHSAMGQYVAGRPRCVPHRVWRRRDRRGGQGVGGARPYLARQAARAAVPKAI